MLRGCVLQDVRYRAGVVLEQVLQQREHLVDEGGPGSSQAPVRSCRRQVLAWPPTDHQDGGCWVADREGLHVHPSDVIDVLRGVLQEHLFEVRGGQVRVPAPQLLDPMEGCQLRVWVDVRVRVALYVVPQLQHGVQHGGKPAAQVHDDCALLCGCCVPAVRAGRR